MNNTHDTPALSDDALAAMVSKIEALFRKAADPGATAPESEAFQAKALALMTKYRIAHVNTDVKPDEKPINDHYGLVKGSYAPFHHAIINSVARAYGCRTYYVSSGRAGDPARRIYVFGFQADTDRIKQLSALFITDALAKAARHKTNDPNTTIRWRKSFMAGYAAAVTERFAEAKRLLDQEGETAASTSGALVLVDRAKLVNQAFDQIGGMRSGRGAATGSAAGFAAGKEAGRTSNVGRQSVGGSGRAITGGK